MDSLDTSSFEQALNSLNRSIAVTKEFCLNPHSSLDLQRTLKAGVIQNFEFCYDLAWKMLKRQLEKEYPVPSTIDALSFQELIREGAERHLIKNAKKWLIYRHQRNITSHTYHEDKAESVYQTALEFYPDALSLLQAIQARHP